LLSSENDGGKPFTSPGSRKSPRISPAEKEGGEEGKREFPSISDMTGRGERSPSDAWDSTGHGSRHSRKEGREKAPRSLLKGGGERKEEKRPAFVAERLGLEGGEKIVNF